MRLDDFAFLTARVKAENLQLISKSMIVVGNKNLQKQIWKILLNDESQIIVF